MFSSCYKFRKIEDMWLRRITGMLSDVNNPGAGFHYWLKKNGMEADKIGKEAAESGTRNHKAAEIFISHCIDHEITEYDKIDISLINECTKDLINKDEIERFFFFLGFCKKYSPKFLHHEIVLNDDKCSGQADIVCKIEDELWLLDEKYGKGIYDNHHMQVSFYCLCYELEFGERPQGGILHLNTSNKSGYSFKKVDFNKWIRGYEHSWELYCLRGFPTEPKE